MKHIESIQPEYAADDMTALLLTDATASAALSRLLHNVTGCAIPPTADTPQSEVEELVPLCLSILRRHWTTPLTALGDGTTPMSLADLLRRLILGRVDGNEALGIPPANANIPTAVAALLDRKIGGVPEAADGVPLVRLACNSATAATVTELTDDTDWGTATHANIASLLNLFPNLKKFAANCIGEVSAGLFNNRANLEEIAMPKITKLRRYDSGSAAIVNCAALKKVDMESVNEVYADGAPDYPCIHNCPNLEYVRLGTITVRLANLLWAASSAKLLHMEIGAGSNVSINFSGWVPDSETLAHEDFLQNFKTYIANRLTDKGSGLTLTLSQAVRDAIQTDPDIVNIITSKGWTISPAPSV